MYWEKEIETMDRGSLEKMQLARLGETLERAKKSVHYGNVLRSWGWIRSASEPWRMSQKLPLTTKEDLREQWPYGFLACSRDELVRMHSSSGTTGRATVIFHTANDIAAWTNLLARSMYMTGMRRSDVFQNMMTYGLFTGGLGFHYGAEKIGALVIPAGRREQQAPDPADAGFRDHGHPHHPQLRPSPLDGLCGDRRRSAPGHEAEDRLSRRRTAFGEDAAEDRGTLRLQGLQLLRPLGDERSRAWPSSVRNRTGCTSGRTTTSSRSSIP